MIRVNLIGRRRHHRFKHGRSNDSIHHIWLTMLARCYNPKAPKYKRYGGRGIIVCERWHTFENFLADMGERPQGLTLDRENTDGNYEPTNCRWATWAMQRQNRSDTKLDADKIAMIIAAAQPGISKKQLALKYDINVSTVYRVLNGQIYREMRA